MHSGVVQYDLGKITGPFQFERRGFLSAPPKPLLTAIARLQAQHDIEGTQILRIPTEMHERRLNLVSSGYVHPGVQEDNLHCGPHESRSENLLYTRLDSEMILRIPRANPYPAVHCGIAASGNQVIKSAEERDRLSAWLGANCVEMEAAGLMNDCLCVVIGGICDYVDGHKNDRWQKYAAMMAAAYAKELMSRVPLTNVAPGHLSANQSELHVKRRQ